MREEDGIIFILEANNPSRAETEQRPRMRFALEALISILFKTSTTKLNRRGERIPLSKLFTIYQKIPNSITEFDSNRAIYGNGFDRSYNFGTKASFLEDV
jgi:hypothetical protein